MAIRCAADTPADLPAAARRYVEFVERGVGVPVALVGTGQERERVLTRPDAALVA